LNLWRGLENLGVQFVSHAQATKNINGSSFLEFEPIVLHNLRPTFVFGESMEHPEVDVVKVPAEKSA